MIWFFVANAKKNEHYMKPTIIAYYLPQFYPFKENDEWWGKGFTEWTNVGKAKPLWKGHYQPRVPADLGYYDLRVPEVREQQAELAREAGVTAFCYWHYWFGNGKRLLERVFDEVLESGKPDFPFCLGWANHSWYAKTWDKDTNKDRLLIEQTYPGIEDAKAHFKFLIKAFNDPRYLKIDGKPLFLIFETKNFPGEYLSWFRQWTKDAGFPDLYIVANIFNRIQDSKEVNHYREIGYDAVVDNKLNNGYHYDIYMKFSSFSRRIYLLKKRIKKILKGIPMRAVDYDFYFSNIDKSNEKNEHVISQLVPQWDHSPRSNKKAAFILYNSNPDTFYRHAKNTLEIVKEKPQDKQIVFLKSWNEWAEGNYMEPDLKYGKGYIYALRKAIKDVYGE